MKFVLIAVFLVVCATIVIGLPTRFDNDAVYKVYVDNREHSSMFRAMRDNNIMNLDFWTEIPGLRGSFDVHVPVTSLHLFSQLVQEQQLSVKVLTPNLQAVIDDELASRVQHRAGDIVGTYARHAAINEWLEEKCSEHSDIASCSLLGSSTQGREIKFIKISDAPNKPIVWVDAGMHAREWITHATVVWMIDFLLKNKNTPAVKEILDQYAIYMMPCANPDGYDYTMGNSDGNDRVWRKTRSRHAGHACVGVDPNRNFDYQWGVVGSSGSSCSDTYRGPRAASEPEVAALSAFLSDNANRINMYYGLHSYSQLWLTNWGHTGAKPDDWEDIWANTIAGVAAIRATHGNIYVAGSPYDILYAASGSQNDYAKSVGIKYAYGMELRPKSSFGTLGFIVNENEIQPSGEEIWAGIRATILDMTARKGTASN